MDIFPLAAAGLVGLVLGSFLNVLVYRLPRGLNIAVPGSACVHCKTPIRPVDNIPVLSYLFLGGKCRACGGRISLRYPLTELAVGGLFVVMYIRFSDGLMFGKMAVFGFLLLAAAITDIDTLLDREHFACGIIPDWITLGGIIIGLASSLATPPGLTASFLGMIAGFSALFIPAFVYGKLAGVESMGMGDMKLFAMIGAFIGYEPVVFVLMTSAVLGSLIGIPVIIITGDRQFPLPFGPMLAAAALLYLFAGEPITRFVWGLIS